MILFVEMARNFEDSILRHLIKYNKICNDRMKIFEEHFLIKGTHEQLSTRLPLSSARYKLKTEDRKKQTIQDLKLNYTLKCSLAVQW